jgi:hypothetical protein
MTWRASLNYLNGPVEVTIADGRAADLPGWETCGFERLDHAPAVAGGRWSDDDAIVGDHYPEMEALAQKLTGCDHALVSGHIKRNVDEAARHKDLAPITLVHSDFADSYGPQIRERYRRAEPGFRESLERADIRPEVVAEASRIVILQFWRNVGPPKMDLPLAFCDCRTVPRPHVQAFGVTNYAGGGFDFEALGVRAPSDRAAHAWYAFDSLRDDEVIAFRTFDSDLVPTGEPYWTPHSAFRDPDVELGRPSRSSIELRATCVFA